MSERARERARERESERERESKRERESLREGCHQKIMGWGGTRFFASQKSPVWFEARAGKKSSVEEKRSQDKKLWSAFFSFSSFLFQDEAKKRKERKEKTRAMKKQSLSSNVMIKKTKLSAVRVLPSSGLNELTVLELWAVLGVQTWAFFVRLKVFNDPGLQPNHHLWKRITRFF